MGIAPPRTVYVSDIDVRQVVDVLVFGDILRACTRKARTPPAFYPCPLILERRID